MTVEARLDAGYKASAQVQKAMLPFMKPAPMKIIIDGIIFHITLVIATVLVAYLIEIKLLSAAIAYPLVAVFAARQLRAFELIVHDSSHYNFMRQHRFLNDWVANILFAAPVAQIVGRYRTTHRLHHQKFGTSLDPCRDRMLNVALEDPRRWKQDETLSGWVTRIIRFYFRYTTQYYRAVAQEGPCLTVFALWHVTVSFLMYILGAQLGLGTTSWFAAWIAVWVVPLFVFLPAQRMLAELGEHDYLTGKTEFDATISNVGLLHRAVFHPWNDSYHLLHHLFQNIPQTRHLAAHRALDEVDPLYRGRRLRRSVGGRTREGP